MSEPTTVNGDKRSRDGEGQQPAAQLAVDKMKELMSSLDEGGKKDLAMELVGAVIPAEVKKDAIAHVLETVP